MISTHTSLICALLWLVHICGQFALATPAHASASLTCPFAGRTLSVDELNMVLDAHSKSFKESFDSMMQPSRANLCKANLSGMNLSNANLVDANLTGADLTGADLSQAKLINAHLSHAKLKGAVLRNAFLSDAVFLEADLTEADLSRTISNGARFQRAKLAGANLSESRLEMADFFDANLTRADLSKSDLNGAQFSRANLSEANLSGSVLMLAMLQNANMERANLKGVNLEKAKAQGADFSEADLTESSLRAAQLQKATMKGTTLIRTTFTGANLSEANLNEAKLSGAVLTNVDVENTSWAEAELTNVTFEVKPPVDPIYFRQTEGLSKMIYRNDRRGLMSLREGFVKIGMRDQERELIYALKHSDSTISWFKGNKFESSFNYLFFEATSHYGMSPGRPLKIIGLIIITCATLYMYALSWSTRIKLVWPDKVLRNDDPYAANDGTDDSYALNDRVIDARPDRFFLPYSRNSILVRAFGVFIVGYYFSALTSLHIGYRGFSMGSWISLRIQPREYALVATGWVKAIAGVQSIVSIYLLALSLITYFGRPFE